MRMIVPFWLGFIDWFRFGGVFGRTSDEDQDWNEAYDHGRNLGERLWR